MTRPLILSVASGKGGVGKTLTAVNMALASRRMGMKTLLLDGDLGMANVDIVLGLRSRYSIIDVLENGANFQDVLIEGPMGLHIVPSGSGLARLADLSLGKRIELLEKLEEISDRYDLLVIDTGAGISSNVTHLNSVSDAIMVVTTAEPHAMTDAYAFLKVMFERFGERNFNIIVNQAISEDQGLKTYQKLADVSRRFLGIELRLGGVVPKDTTVERSVMMQRAGDDGAQHTRSGQAWNQLTIKVLESLKGRELSEKGRGIQDLIFPAVNQTNYDVL